jgi:hypothetical protein
VHVLDVACEVGMKIESGVAFASSRACKESGSALFSSESPSDSNLFETSLGCFNTKAKCFVAFKGLVRSEEDAEQIC